jgi:hypothetical protein
MESAERKREDAEETRRREEFIGINKLRDSTPDFLSQSASMWHVIMNQVASRGKFLK